MAPKGHMKRQKGRKTKVDISKILPANNPFHTVKLPAAERKPSLTTNKGSAPSTVPAGQIYLQNKGSHNPITAKDKRGPKKTRPRKAYFTFVNRLVIFDFLIFLQGTQSNKS